MDLDGGSDLNTWELLDPSKRHVVGFVDPGEVLDGDRDRLALVNCAVTRGELSAVCAP